MAHQWMSSPWNPHALCRLVVTHLADCDKDGAAAIEGGRTATLPQKDALLRRLLKTASAPRPKRRLADSPNPNACMNRTTRILILAMACLLFTANQGESDRDTGHFRTDTDRFLEEVRERLQTRIEQRFGGEGFMCRGEPICGIRSIPLFYEARGYAPAWFNGQGLRPAALAMARAIREAPEEGLSAADYHLMPIEQLMAEIDPVSFPSDLQKAGLWADLDLLLSDGFLLLAAHLAGGRVDPETLHPDWIGSPAGIDISALLDASTGDTPIDSILEDLKPNHSGYAELRLALQQMRQSAVRGGWPQVMDGPKLQPLERDPRVPDLRLRLQLSGDLTQENAMDPPEETQKELAKAASEDPAVETQELANEPPPENDDLFGIEMSQALMRFQSRHGLETDGILGRRTLAALNVTAEERARQIELNLERWRWMPSDLGRRHIMVNTADFRLSVVEDGRTVLEMPVVVGRPARRTPVFSALMTYMVLNPSWTVPHTIAVEDILPRLKAGENYLQEHAIHLFSGWNGDAVELDPQTVDWSHYSKRRFPFQLRQDPGPRNALGDFKFMFPNKFAVYLHDTPQRNLFKKVQRDFSSGCIRVENAPALAAYLLRDNSGWSEARLRAAIRNDAGERVIIIRNPLPVHLVYQTSWVDRDRRLHFRNDIYGRDKALDAALRQRAASAASVTVKDMAMK